MCANSGRVHPAQASLPWRPEEVEKARELAALDIVPVREIVRLFPERSISSVKTKIYSLRTGRGACMSGIRIDGSVTLDPDDPGIEDRDLPAFEDSARLGSEKLLSALQRAGYA